MHFAWSKRRKRQERLVKKGNDGIQKGCCRQPTSKDYTWNKGKGTDQEQARKELVLNPSFHPLKSPNEEGNRPTHVFLALAAHGRLDHRLQPKDSRSAMYKGMTTEFCHCNESFVFANSELETCMGSFIHFPTTPPCSTKVDVLETRRDHHVFRSLRCKIWIRPLSWTQKEAKLKIQLGLCSFPSEFYNVTYYVGQDESCPSTNDQVV